MAPPMYELPLGEAAAAVGKCLAADSSLFRGRCTFFRFFSASRVRRIRTFSRLFPIYRPFRRVLSRSHSRRGLSIGRVLCPCRRRQANEHPFLRHRSVSVKDPDTPVATSLALVACLGLSGVGSRSAKPPSILLFVSLRPRRTSRIIPPSSPGLYSARLLRFLTRVLPQKRPSFLPNTGTPLTAGSAGRTFNFFCSHVPFPGWRDNLSAAPLLLLFASSRFFLRWIRRRFLHSRHSPLLSHMPGAWPESSSHDQEREPSPCDA